MGETTPPGGVPLSGELSASASSTPACSHVPINRHIPPSCPLCCINACRWLQSRVSNDRTPYPLNNPPIDDPTEVEVTDPGHPLFGRRFVLLSTRPRSYSVGYLFVASRDTMVLRIPQTATNLVSPPPPSVLLSKLTSHAITELISLAEQCAVLCPATQPQSGIDSRPRGKPVAAPTSRCSSRR